MLCCNAAGQRPLPAADHQRKRHRNDGKHQKCVSLCRTVARVEIAMFGRFVAKERILSATPKHHYVQFNVHFFCTSPDVGYAPLYCCQVHRRHRDRPDESSHSPQHDVRHVRGVLRRTVLVSRFSLACDVVLTFAFTVSAASRPWRSSTTRMAPKTKSRPTCGRIASHQVRQSDPLPCFE